MLFGGAGTGGAGLAYGYVAYDATGIGGRYIETGGATLGNEAAYFHSGKIGGMAKDAVVAGCEVFDETEMFGRHRRWV